MLYRFVSSVIIPLFLATSFIGCGSTRPAASVAASPNLTITTTSMPSGTVGSSYSFALNAQGGVSPYSWSIASGSLPAGLQLNVTGLVAGSPSAASSQTIGFSVQDSAQHSAAAKLTLSIGAGTNGSTTSSLNITTTSLPAATVGSAYNFVLAAQGGTPPYTWSLVSGTLPQGLLLDPSSGTITGTPTLPADGIPTPRPGRSRAPAV